MKHLIIDNCVFFPGISLHIYLISTRSEAPEKITSEPPESETRKSGLTRVPAALGSSVRRQGTLWAVTSSDLVKAGDGRAFKDMVCACSR